MKLSFGAWEVKYFYFSCLLFSINEGSTKRNCTFHSQYCFLVEHIQTPISTIADLGKLCQIWPNAWPLEIYDYKVQKALDKYLKSLDSSYSLKTVFLNVERSEGGWQYVQDYDKTARVDWKNINHHDEVAFYDTFEDKIETGWMNYFQLPFVCSYKLSSLQCNRTDSLVTSDLCFTKHESLLKWVQALNLCRSRNGYLALVKYHHKNQLRQWLESSSPDLTQWWIGLAWRPLKWRKKGTIVTWWNFHPDTRFMLTPQEIHFQIEDDRNRWKVQKSFNSSDLVVCMTEQDFDVCNGRECQMESKRMISVVEISVIVVVVVVVVVAVVVAIRFWLRKKKRREISKGTDTATPFKTVPDPCSRSKQPIYLQPLPDIYEKTYQTIDENQYEKLMA